ncbi:hypothetical protein JMF97_28635 [Micromonospora fiedleri]|uniref:Helicase/secretion neighborhood CpaE-like protein n=1 Tax=Micromonospora fiedleri TaxID=1157498 RepID=A0ABS1UYZ9_9ACTN|nr:hypothetical protein [Micromonospora fiedleri]MBL6280135.1 hypothetical protein [Micromonospora fiedleri]
MSKPLLVAWGHEFVDEVLDALGPDLEMEVVVGKPTVDQWRNAPLVLVDAHCRTLANGMPAHPRMEVVAPEALYGDRLAEVFRAWQADYPDAAVYALPRAADGLREIVATAATGRQIGEVRIGVVGGHGGAGATTLAVAIALAAADEGRRTVLVDAAGRGGVDDRLGTPAMSLRVVDAPDLPAREIERTPAEVKVVDLDRALDGSQVDAARLCDVVLLVANVQRNAMASRRVAQRLAGAGVRFAVIPTWTDDAAAQALAEECAVRLVDEVPLDPASVFSDGRVYLIGQCDLLAMARELLHRAPSFVARVAA